MRSYNELQSGCAFLLKSLRQKQKLSKFKMARLLMIDDHTWARYESGDSAPTVPVFFWMFDQLHEDVLRKALDYLYPEIYEGLDDSSDPAAIRAALVHFFANEAPDRFVREAAFLSFGGHGSNFGPQMEMFTMLDHLPMRYRVGVADLIKSFYEIAEARGELVSTECVMPDLDLFNEGLEKGRAASFAGHNSYTTSIKK